MFGKFRRKLCRLVKVYYHLGEKITLYLGKIVFLLKENSNVCVANNFPGKGKFLVNHSVCVEYYAQEMIAIIQKLTYMDVAQVNC